MDFFKRKKKLEDQEEINEEMRDEETTEEIPFTDKRRTNINVNGESATQTDETPKAETKSAEVAKLENALKEERNRREAAESKLVGVQSKFEEVKNGLERETAEMRERLKKSLEQRAMQGQFNFLITLLPVLDNLHLAIRAAENSTADEGLLSGLRGTANGFEMALLQVGVEPIMAVGEKFDPELHEAVDTVHAEPENDEIVTAEYSRGYRFGERLLRPTRVQVGRASAQQAAAE